MAYIDKIKITSNGDDYDIYATSGAKSAHFVDSVTTALKATSAGQVTYATNVDKLNATHTIKLSGQVVGSATTDFGNNVSITTTIKTTPWSAISSNVSTSGAKTNAATGAWTTNTNTGFVVPNDAKTYIDKKTTAMGIDNGIYQVQGSTTFANLGDTAKHKYGYVYNVSTSGTIPTTSGYNKQTYKVEVGDNLVWIKGDGTNAQDGWDKLGETSGAWADKLLASNYASATYNNFTAKVSTSGTNWDNSLIKAFGNVKVGTTTIQASNSGDSFVVNGSTNIGVTTANNTMTIAYKGVSGYSKVNVYPLNSSTTSSVFNATAMGDVIGFAKGSNITLTPTTTTAGNPVIKIDKTDNNTKYPKAETATLGMVQKTYYSETDTTNHIGTLVVQGSMNSNTFNSAGSV